MVMGLSNIKLEEESKAAEEIFRQIRESSDKENPEETALPADGLATSIPEENKADVDVKKPETPIEKKEDTSEYWEHRLDVMRGQYQSEKKELSKQIDSLTTQNQELQKQLNELKTLVENNKSNSISENNKASITNTELDIRFKRIKDTLGEEVFDDLMKVVESKKTNIPEEFGRKLSEIEKKIQETDKRQKLTEHQTYLNKINSIPDLIKKNTDPKFLEWLPKKVPFGGGKSFQNLLDEASNRMDAEGVSEIFDGFFKPNGNKANADITEVVEPAKSKPGKTTDFGNKEIYTKKEIDQFDSDVIRGKYSGNEKAQKEKEEEYRRAIAEDRIR